MAATDARADGGSKLIWGGFVVLTGWCKCVFVGGAGQTVYNRILPKQSRFILRRLEPARNRIQKLAVGQPATGEHWLTDCLLKAGYRVYVTEQIADGELAAARLAGELLRDALSNGTYLATNTSPLPLYLGEMLEQYSLFLRAMGGASLQDRFEHALNDLAIRSKMRLRIEGARVELRPNGLATAACRKVAAEAYAQMVQVVGDNSARNQLTDLDQRRQRNGKETFSAELGLEQ